MVVYRARLRSMAFVPTFAGVLSNFVIEHLLRFTFFFAIDKQKFVILTHFHHFLSYKDR